MGSQGDQPRRSPPLRERAAAKAKDLRRVALAAETRGEQFAHGFKDFLKNYGILSLAIAFIIGAAVNRTVSSMVNDILMPIVTFFIPEGNWEQWVIPIGSIQLKLGSFIGNLIEFLIIALVVYLIAKWILKEEKVGKK